MVEDKKNIVGICPCCSEKIHKAWQKKNAKLKIKEGDYIKVACKDKKEIEHMWFIVDLVINDKEFIGILDNEPIGVKNIKLGDRKEIKFEEIEGYLKK